MTDLVRDVVENLYRCITLDAFDNLCSMNCPNFGSCGDGPLPLTVLQPVIESLPPTDRTRRILAALPRCQDETHDTCNNECPYWDDCQDENITFVLRDMYEELKLNGYPVDPPAQNPERS